MVGGIIHGVIWVDVNRAETLNAPNKFSAGRADEIRSAQRKGEVVCLAGC